MPANISSTNSPRPKKQSLWVPQNRTIAQRSPDHNTTTTLATATRSQSTTPTLPSFHCPRYCSCSCSSCLLRLFPSHRHRRPLPLPSFLPHEAPVRASASCACEERRSARSGATDGGPWGGEGDEVRSLPTPRTRRTCRAHAAASCREKNPGIPRVPPEARTADR